MADKEVPDLTDGGAVQSGDQAAIYRAPNSRKGTFGDAAGKDVGTASGTVAAGDDSRFPSAILTTRGDMIRRGASAPERFAKGALGKILRMGANDPDWADQITLATPVASTSGTAIDFTGIPASAKRVKVMFSGVSSNSTSSLMIQLGDAGGIETSGYTSGASTAGGTMSTSSAGFLAMSINAAADTFSGSYTLDLYDAATNTWVGTGLVNEAGTDRVQFAAGTKALSATLDRIRVTTVSGTGVFDAGSINISYE